MFNHGVAEKHTATLPRPGLLRIRSTYVTDGNCGGKACPEELLQEDEIEVPSLPVEERIRVVLRAGKELDFSCQTGEFEP